MYESMTESNIRKNMLDRVTAPVSKVEGTLIYDSISPVANELAKHYMELDSILLRGFAQTSYDEYLDKKASEFGLYRKKPTKAAGKLKITGTPGTSVDAGMIVSTVTKQQYVTVENIALDVSGTGYSIIEAYESGVGYNTEIGTVNEIVTSVNGVSSVVNEGRITGGTDTESDNELRERLLSKARKPSTSGNIYHYKEWALAVDGTGDCKIFPNYYGAGTVVVAVIDTNKQPANNIILENVFNNIEAHRPIGATVSVIPPVAVPINIRVTIMKNSSITVGEMKENVTKNIRQVIDESAFAQDYISYGKIANAILTSSGVMDYMNLELNGLTAQNINLRDTDVAILGTVTILVA